MKGKIISKLVTPLTRQTHDNNICVYFSQCYAQQQKKLDAKKQEALKGVLEKALTSTFKPSEPHCYHSIKTYHVMPGK